MTYEINNPQIQALLRETGDSLHKMIPKGWGFCLMIFGFGDCDEMFYISDARREDMIKVLLEFIDKQTDPSSPHSK